MDNLWQVELSEMTISGLFMALCHATQKGSVHWIQDVTGRYHLEWEDILISVSEQDGRFQELQVSSGRLKSIFANSDISAGNKSLQDYVATLVRVIKQDTLSTYHGLENRVKQFISEAIDK